MATITVLNDLHLKPAYDSVVEDFRLPRATDGVVIAGDLLDRDNDASIEQGRRLLARLNTHEVPTVLVPGNHDPLACATQLVEDFEWVQLGHGRRVTDTAFPGETVFGDVAVVGWGCTQFDAGCELEYEEATAFTIRDEHGYVDRYEEAQATETLLAGVDSLLNGATTTETLRSEWGLPRETGVVIDELAETADGIRETLEGTTPTMLATHVPPFGTDLDVHHSAEKREADGLHDGSLALAGAVRMAEPIVAVCGHSHVNGYGTYEGTASHVLNGGFRGVTTVTIENEQFGYAFHEPEWLPGERGE